MLRFFLRFGLVVALSIACASPAAAALVTIDFESLAEFDSVGALIPGVAFSNASILTAGSFLNDIEFPPHSGDNVVFDDGGAIRIDFAAPVSNFAAYFTYAAPLTLQAFDASSVLLGTTTSLYGNNMTASGDAGSSPNELLALSFAGIAYVTLAGDVFGGSYVVDDVSFTTAAATPAVPEPASLTLLGLGLLGLARHVRQRSCG